MIITMEFENELGRPIKIVAETIDTRDGDAVRVELEGPDSTSEWIMTPLEADRVKKALAVLFP